MFNAFIVYFYDSSVLFPMNKLQLGSDLRSNKAALCGVEVAANSF